MYHILFVTASESCESKSRHNRGTLYIYMSIMYYVFIVTASESCESNPCQNGGTCIQLENGYECLCAKCGCANEIAGTNCEVGKCMYIFRGQTIPWL